MGEKPLGEAERFSGFTQTRFASSSPRGQKLVVGILLLHVSFERLGRFFYVWPIGM
jgi:hypothetical protein